MRAFEFACPTKIICGVDALDKLPDEVNDRSVSHPMVVTDANLVKLGMHEHAVRRLTDAGIAFELFDDVPPDSSLTVVDTLAARYRDAGCDGFIALGGGSVIDTTKGAAASVANGGVDFASLQGSEILHSELPPFIAIPTTAGTGSEVTLVAVVADTEAHTKLSYTSYRLVPDATFLDPVLTASLPPKLTATTGMDAMTHAVEAFTGIQSNPVSDALAQGAIRMIARNLDTACSTPGDVDARSELALASCMAGAAFSNAMVGIVHAIGHSLGGLCHIPHGQAMMMLLPHCVRYNLDHGFHAHRYGELLADIDAEAARTITDPDERDRAFLAALERMNAHFHDAYGVPLTLAELGVAEDDLAAVAHKARYDGAALYNEQEIDEETALTILKAVYR